MIIMHQLFLTINSRGSLYSEYVKQYSETKPFLRHFCVKTYRKKSLSSLSSLTTRDPVQGIEPWSTRKIRAVLPLDHTRDPVRGIEPRSIRKNQIVLPLDDTRIGALGGIRTHDHMIKSHAL